MSSRSELVTPELLREWNVPEPGESKKARGRVVVVGGSLHSPGAAMLAGEAALRVGAGHLAIAVSDSIAGGIGVSFPEAGVHPLPRKATDRFEGRLRDQVRAADAVLVGPGFDDPDETADTVRAVAEASTGVLVLDAFALGVLPKLDRGGLGERLILTPNKEEIAILLGRASDGEPDDLREVARRYDAVVSCYGTIVTPAGEAWRVEGGTPGLGTSGSGDVQSGAITGFAARGLELTRAAVWGAVVHTSAGARLTERLGVGYLARDLARELTGALRDLMR